MEISFARYLAPPIEPPRSGVVSGGRKINQRIAGFFWSPNKLTLAHKASQCSSEQVRRILANHCAGECEVQRWNGTRLREGNLTNRNQSKRLCEPRPHHSPAHFSGSFISYFVRYSFNFDNFARRYYQRTGSAKETFTVAVSQRHPGRFAHEGSNSIFFRFHIHPFNAQSSAGPYFDKSDSRVFTRSRSSRRRCSS